MSPDLFCLLHWFEVFRFKKIDLETDLFKWNSTQAQCITPSDLSAESLRRFVKDKELLKENGKMKRRSRGPVPPRLSTFYH